MWNKKDELPVPPRPVNSTPVPAPVPETIKKESSPVSTTPYRMPDAEPRNTATIGKAVKINGQIFAKEDLYVDGDVEGTIESQDNKVTIGPNGRVQAGVRAREVVILGQVQGNVEASDKVDIRKDAKLVGDIKTSRISIEDGALFKGSIDIVKTESKTATASTPQISTPPTPTAPRTMEAGASSVSSMAPAAVPAGAGPKR